MTDTADPNDDHVASTDRKSGRTHPLSRRKLLMALIENPQVCSLKFPTRGPWLL
jgi:hypothetical protein